VVFPFESPFHMACLAELAAPAQSAGLRLKQPASTRRACRGEAGGEIGGRKSRSPRASRRSGSNGLVPRKGHSRDEWSPEQSSLALHSQTYRHAQVKEIPFLARLASTSSASRGGLSINNMINQKTKTDISFTFLNRGASHTPLLI
jgi:hypothetical protein